MPARNAGTARPEATPQEQENQEGEDGRSARPLKRTAQKDSRRPN